MNFIQSILSPTARSTAAFGLGSAPSLSGGEAEDEAPWTFGYSLLRGKRPYMEDFHHAQIKKDSRTGETFGLFGVFDGHGGPNAADYVRSNFFLNLLQSPKILSDLRGAVVETFERTDQQYLRQEFTPNREDGCTAVIAVLVGNRLLVANAGDSRAVLCRGGNAHQMSVDHKPNDPEERKRIEALGGMVLWAGTWRVGGVLAVSRAFGDKPLKKFVVSTPAVFEETLRPDDEFLLMASDGVWDVIQNQEAVNLIRGIPDAEKAARRLAEEAFRKGSNDNITCMVVRFQK